MDDFFYALMKCMYFTFPEIVDKIYIITYRPIPSLTNVIEG